MCVCVSVGGIVLLKEDNELCSDANWKVLSTVCVHVCVCVCVCVLRG